MLKKTTYTNVNCLRVFGFYISILLFMSSAISKLNFKHRAQMQKYRSGNLGDALLLLTDLIYNTCKKPPKVLKFVDLLLKFSTGITLKVSTVFSINF